MNGESLDWADHSPPLLCIYGKSILAFLTLNTPQPENILKFHPLPLNGTSILSPISNHNSPTSNHTHTRNHGENVQRICWPDVYNSNTYTCGRAVRFQPSPQSTTSSLYLKRSQNMLWLKSVFVDSYEKRQMQYFFFFLHWWQNLPVKIYSVIIWGTI